MRRYADLPCVRTDLKLTRAQRFEQGQLQRLGQRFLHCPHRIEESIALGTVEEFQCARLRLGERVACDRQRIARPVKLQIDANAQCWVYSRQRCVAAAMTQAFARRRLERLAAHVRAQRPADRKLLTPRCPAQPRHAIALGVRELSRIKVLGRIGRREPQLQGFHHNCEATPQHARTFMAAHSDFAPEAPTLERRQDAYVWRLLMTGLSFLLFGIGGVVVGMVLLPLVRVVPAAHEHKRRRARTVMRLALRLFVGVMHRLGVLTYEFRGRERLGRPGQLILANHPSLIDVVFLLAFVPDAGCVVKAGLWRNPLTRGAVTLAEFIRNDSTAEMIMAAAGALHTRQPLIFFPEGTRTRPRRPLVFHRSGANIALRAAASVTPVYIRVAPTTLTKAEPWHRIPPRRPHFSLIVGPDIDLQAFQAAPLPIGSRELNERLQALFEAELACPA